MKTQTSGLDMAPTLRWYEENYHILFHKIPDPEHLPANYRTFTFFPLRGVKYLQPSKYDLLAWWWIFPHQAQERSVLRQIVGKPAAWFHRDSLVSEVGPIKTGNPKEILSPTAIIPSYCDYSRWQKTGVPTCDIHLYDIHFLSCPNTVRHVIYAEGFIHEVAHSIIAPALYNDGDYLLRLPDGETLNGTVKGNDWLKNVFGAAAEKHTPISHYVGAYRNRDNTFKIDSGGNIATAVSEEMAECIAALLLNFVFCHEKRRRLDPFRDRPEVCQMVRDFLHARHIPANAATAKSA